MQSGFRFISVFGVLVGGYLFLWTTAIWQFLYPSTGGMNVVLLAELSALVGLTSSGVMWALLLWQRRILRRGTHSLPIEVRIYRLSLVWRAPAIVLATLAGCGGLWVMHWAFYVDYINNKLPAGWVLFTVASLYIAGGAFIAITTTTYEAVYDLAGVEIRCAIPFRGMHARWLRSDTAAKKNVSILALMPAYVLYPRDRNAKKFLIWVPKEDDYFRNWIAGIPDADRQYFRKRRKSGRKP